MKKIIPILIFLLAVNLCNAISKNNTNTLNKSTNHIINYEINDNTYFEESCTIKQGQQVISNGEVVFEYIAVLHIDGMTCEEFFTAIIEAYPVGL